MTDPFDQSPYAARFDWGPTGARRAAERGDIVVIVDVLSFSSAVATAVAHGVLIHPCGTDGDAAALAARAGAVPAVVREDVPDKGRYSLSPLTYVGAPAGTRVALRSPNGALCCLAARESPRVFIGSLLNAAATARAVAEEMAARGSSATIVACGERWDMARGETSDLLRVALEDGLGAGAILEALRPLVAGAGADAIRTNTHVTPRKRSSSDPGGSSKGRAPGGRLSPEAEVCARAFASSRECLLDLLLACASGRELRLRGCENEVHHSAQIDRYGCAAVMIDGVVRAAPPDGLGLAAGIVAEESP